MPELWKTVLGGLADKYFCDDCSKKLRAERTKQEKICEDCGRSFIGGPKSFRCPDCQRKINDRRKQANKYYGAERPLGSTDRCIVCGKEYVVEGGLQKYCSAKCRLIGLDSYNKRRKENIEQKKEKKGRNEGKSIICLSVLQAPFCPRRIIRDEISIPFVLLRLLQKRRKKDTAVHSRY